MKFDDIIGLLFLLFFIVGPILRGFFRPSEPLIEVELPEVEPAEPAQPPAQQPAPQQAAPAKPAAQPESRPAASPTAAPGSTPTPVVQKDTAQRAEGHAAGARSRQRNKVAQLDASEMAASEQRAFATRQNRPRGRSGLKTHRRAIVNGMLWHEILSEPASLRHRVRRRRKKLLS
ncbi:hypothetical protein [Oceanithermus sp.]